MLRNDRMEFTRGGGLPETGCLLRDKVGLACRLVAAVPLPISASIQIVILRFSVKFPQNHVRIEISF